MGCPDCGEEHEEHWSFCAHCGFPIPPAVADIVENADIVDEPVEEPEANVVADVAHHALDTIEAIVEAHEQTEAIEAVADAVEEIVEEESEEAIVEAEADDEEEEEEPEEEEPAELDAHEPEVLEEEEEDTEVEDLEPSPSERRRHRRSAPFRRNARR